MIQSYCFIELNNHKQQQALMITPYKDYVALLPLDYNALLNHKRLNDDLDEILKNICLQCKDIKFNNAVFTFVDENNNFVFSLSYKKVKPKKLTYKYKELISWYEIPDQTFNYCLSQKDINDILSLSDEQ